MKRFAPFTTMKPLRAFHHHEAASRLQTCQNRRSPMTSPVSSVGYRGLINMLGLLVVALALGSVACENKHIGRTCGLSVDPDAGVGSGLTATLDVALECPSRICILPAQESGPVTTTSLCTADCSSDDDCSDGERRGSDP